MATHGWQRAIALCLGMSGAIGFSMSPAVAQSVIVPDNTLGNENSQVIPNFQPGIELITGGATRGSNLFHSFQEFNVTQGRSAYFFSPDASIQNILARITGNNPSNIDGRLGTFLFVGGQYLPSNANLFLINPNGIIFGAGASLDVGGSFVATTANAVQFPNGDLFSASVPTVPSPALTVNPSALLYNAIAAQNAGIVNRSQLNDPNNLVGTTTGLQVRDGRSLLLVGGDVRLEGGTLQATTNGRIELGGLSDTGSINLIPSNDFFRLGFPDTAARANVFITNGSRIQVTTLASGGDVSIHAQNVEISQGSSVGIGIGSIPGTVGGRAGDIDINARGTVTLSDTSLLLNSVLLGSANGGNINILGQTVNVLGGSIVATPSFADGDAGSINIQANDNITFAGINTTNGTSSRVFTGISPLALPGFSAFSGKGNGGDVILQAQLISFADGASVSTEVPSEGKSGDIRVNATDSLSMKDGSFFSTATSGQGNAGNISIQAGNLVSFEGINSSGSRGGLISRVNSVAGVIQPRRGGDIIVKTGVLYIANGAALESSTYALGDAGRIIIQADDSVILENTGLIFSTVEPGGNGNGGNIEITANSLFLKNGSQIISVLREANPTANLPGGQGKSGDVLVHVSGTFSATGLGSNGVLSGVFAGVQSGTEGNGGNVDIKASLFSLTDDARISTETFGSGSGGNITINADEFIARSGGQIAGGSGREDVPGSFGRGGDVTINVSGSIEIDAKGGVQGRSGIFTETSSPSYAGDLTVITKRLTIKNGGAISSGAAGSGSLGGDGGNLTVNASESIELIGREGRKDGSLGRASVLTTEANGLGNAGKLQVNTGRLSIRDGAAISAVVTEGNFDADDNFIPTIGNGGNIDIIANSLDLSNGGQIQANTYGIGNAGNIKIQISGPISLNAVNGSNVGIFSGVEIGAKGRGGDITVKAQSLSLTSQANRANISTATASEGNAGNLSIIVDGSIDLSRGYIFSDVDAGGVGKAGNIQIRSRSLTLVNEGQIASSVSPASGDQPAGKGQGGIIDINTSDFVLISGTSATGFSSGIFGNTRTGASGPGGDIIIDTNTFRIADGGVVTTQTQNASDAGNVTIRANTFEALSGGQILATTYNAGNAGNITIAANNISISGSDPNFASRFARFGENIVANVAPESGVFANTTSASIGNGGNLSLTATNLNLTNGGLTSAQSDGAGRAGDISVNVSHNYSANNGQILAAAKAGGGNINVTARDIRLRGNSDIRTNSSGGDGGNITDACLGVI